MCVCVCVWGGGGGGGGEGVDEVTSFRKKNMCAANRQSQEKTFVCVHGKSFRRQETGEPH